MPGTVLQQIWNLDSSMISARAVPAPSPPGVSHPQTPRSTDRPTDNAMTLGSTRRLRTVVTYSCSRPAVTHHTLAIDHGTSRHSHRICDEPG